MATIAAPPSWLTDWLKVEQDRADRKYSDEMRSYEQNRTSWLENNIRMREQAADPSKFVPTPPPPIPQRAVWKVTESGMALDFTSVADPAISNPVLPPRVQPPPPVILKTDAPETTDAMLAMLRGCLAMLADLSRGVAEIKAKLGMQ